VVVGHNDRTAQRDTGDAVTRRWRIAVVVLRYLCLTAGVVGSVVGSALGTKLLIDYAEAVKFRSESVEWSVWSWGSGPDYVRVDYVPGERRAYVSSRLFVMSECPEQVVVESHLEWGSSVTFCQPEGIGSVGFLSLTATAPADLDDSLARELAASYRTSWVLEGKERTIVNGESIQGSKPRDARPISFPAFAEEWWARKGDGR
jgi:hypothetical protein